VHEYKLGPEGSQIDVCRRAWATAHNVSVVMLETLSYEYKRGIVNASRSFSDRSHSFTKAKAAELALMNNNLEVTEERIKVMVLPNSDASRACYSWMKEYFEVAGDHMPNSKEIHLENQSILKLYKQYTNQTFSICKLGYTAWRNMWKELFPHVKMREYKQVTGKCQCCALLSRLRGFYVHPKLKELVTNLHEIHRYTYMNERYAYYERREEAETNPHEVLSCISDGMAQTHTQCPYLANQARQLVPYKRARTHIYTHSLPLSLSLSHAHTYEHKHIQIHTYLRLCMYIDTYIPI